MVEKQSTKSHFKAGIYLLENITSGMYNEPLAVLREYIQNSVDSIDEVHQNSSLKAEVNIDLDPINSKIVIRDNGQGIPAAIAEEVLCSIGGSRKITSRLRGFRGIGRLGGIAFSEKANFRTKAAGEQYESIQEWDCLELRKIISQRKKNPFSLSHVLKRITNFSQNSNDAQNGGYFEVTLEGVRSFRNYLFDITRVKRYLSQVAPVPFNPLHFRFATIIREHLSKTLSFYREYDLILNGEPIVKPYADRVLITKGGTDQIQEIEFFDLFDSSGNLLSVGWYGKREELLGSIMTGCDSSGIRVRSGNIMIGDNHLLDGCFREARFNSYLPGEIHIENRNLIPNSRRDDFIDNQAKLEFYNAFEKAVGVPLSKEIRRRSKEKSKIALRPPQSPTIDVKTKPSLTDVDYAKKFCGNNTSGNGAKSITAERLVELVIAHKILNTCQNCTKLQSMLKTH